MTRETLLIIGLALILFGFCFYGCTPNTELIERVAEAYAISIAFNFLNTVYINSGFPKNR